MNGSESLPYSAAVEDYQREALALFDALKSGEEAEWRFKWEHPGFRGRGVDDVRAAKLDLSDAQEVIAREYGFEAWPELVEFTQQVRQDPSLDRFERAV